MSDPKLRDDGAPWRNFYGRRHGKKLRDAQADLIENRLVRLAPPGVSWSDNPDRLPIDLAELFPDAEEVWLEIGFGGGEHLLSMAKRYPNVGIIGCEPYINGVAKLLSAEGRMPVANISITSADARDVMDVLPIGSIDKVFLLYPDPWPKVRHHKRRFVNPSQLDLVARCMREGAEMRVATDIADYVRHSLEVFRQDPRFHWDADKAEDWRVPWSDWPGTRYEAKALREGRTPHYLTFTRTAKAL